MGIWKVKVKKGQKSLDAISSHVKGYCNNGRDFIVDHKRDTHGIIHMGKWTVVTRSVSKIKFSIKKSEIVSLFSRVTKSVNKHIVENDFFIEEIKQIHTSSKIDRIKYAEMKEGEIFFYVDVNHCFWRIAYLFGYLTPRLYNEVLQKDKFKTYRNMALACIVAPRSRDYYINGVKIITITEDKTLHKRIYDNIRYASYNLMGDIFEYTKEYCIGYRTDGIMIKTIEAVEAVKDILSENNLDFTVVECKKVNDKEFIFGEKGIKKI